MKHGRGGRPRRASRSAAGSTSSGRCSSEPASTDPIWSEVPKSKYAPERVEKALDEGAETMFVWGGDGMVQRCVDALAGSRTSRLAIIPAGTANLFASNLGIPDDIAEAVRDRPQRPSSATLDVGKINGEHFAVMAGAGLDARMIQRRRRRPEGQLRAPRLHLGGLEEPSSGALQGARRGERRPLVQGRRELPAGRQRRRALRRTRGLRQRVARRRTARGRRDSRGEPRAVGADRRPHRDRLRRSSRRSCR